MAVDFGQNFVTKLPLCLTQLIIEVFPVTFSSQLKAGPTQLIKTTKSNLTYNLLKTLPINKLMSVFYASVLLLMMNFVIALSK